jgi:hypothetical protein
MEPMSGSMESSVDPPRTNQLEERSKVLRPIRPIALCQSRPRGIRASAVVRREPDWKHAMS